MFNVDDMVIIRKASNASLNLYMKAKQKGLSYVKCPCNAKTGQVFRIKSLFGKGGFLLQGENNGLITVAFSNDLRRVNINE